MEEKSIIEVKNISKIYGNKVILKNINFLPYIIIFTTYTV